MHCVGLGLISESELKVMVQEMDEKFTHLSDLLVSDLEKRDRLITEINIKNKFISAMLRVQSLRHSNSLASGYVLDTIARHKLRTKTSEDKVNGKVSFFSLKHPTSMLINFSFCHPLFLIVLLKIMIGV